MCFFVYFKSDECSFIAGKAVFLVNPLIITTGEKLLRIIIIDE